MKRAATCCNVSDFVRIPSVPLRWYRQSPALFEDPRHRSIAPPQVISTDQGIKTKPKLLTLTRVQSICPCLCSHHKRTILREFWKSRNAQSECRTSGQEEKTFNTLLANWYPPCQGCFGDVLPLTWILTLLTPGSFDKILISRDNLIGVQETELTVHAEAQSTFRPNPWYFTWPSQQRPLMLPPSKWGTCSSGLPDFGGQ